ncbi:hypothetical protein H310_03091 [Aphanomyces invadans]|uniref:PRA1 family protein n=1 Tax=Aphanomyces invadans TaxID=157072 RepID=A0A024UMB8_9STRA|nr:hypothetical protein H310_03091 [Aphanomyces invadans]ETW06992.1 hypothetical protein H310_03091 [Aphanomyces invadans]|eukprot:XP_008865067.1 hypothetical protein H310_03091 [Aphanomyces invadans]
MGEAQQRPEQRHKASAGSDYAAATCVQQDSDDIKIHSILGQVVSAARQRIHVNAIRNVFVCMGVGEAHPFNIPTPPQIAPRLQHNLQYFVVNYIMLFTVVLFCTLVFHPWSLLCVLATGGAWGAFIVQRKHLQHLNKNGFKEEHFVYAMLAATLVVFSFFLLPSLITAIGISGGINIVHAFFRDPTHVIFRSDPTQTDVVAPIDQLV